MVNEKLLFLILKQWQIDFLIVTRKNCNGFRKTQKMRTQTKALRPGLLFGPTWVEEKGCSPDILSYEADELDEKLHTFFAEVKKKDGSDYEPVCR